MDSYLAKNKRLLVNGDDFGLSQGVNRGVARAHEEGILTSASLMVRGNAAPEAAAYAHSHPKLSVGLHVDLGEWVYRNGEWVPLYEVASTEDPLAAEEEVRRQLEAFCSLLGANPTHLDSHQHVHMDEPLRTIMSGIAQELRVPLRACTPGIGYCGDFYGQTALGDAYARGISVEALIRVLTSLPGRTTELACHPGEEHDPELERLGTMYRAERAQEVRALCDPRAREALERAGIVLCSFADL